MYWESDELRCAAVEWTLRQAGPAPSGRAGAAATGWMEAVRGCAAQLEGVEAEVLAGWCRAAEYMPSGDVRFGAGGGRPDDFAGGGGEEDGAERGSRMAEGLAEVPEGALPVMPPDPLEYLLAAECDVLHEEERKALAMALERGEPLRRDQRLALAVLLRGAEMASRRDVVRAVLDFIVPQDGSVTTIWEERVTMLTAPAGSVGVQVPMGRKIPGCASLLGGSMLVISEGDGTVWRVVPYSRLKRVGASANGQKVLFTVRMLVPRESFARDHVLRQFALLASLVREETRNGQEWAQLFGTTKADVSWTRKKLVKKVETATGSAVGWRQVRHKPDPRKGRKLGEGGSDGMDWKKGNEEGRGA